MISDGQEIKYQNWDIVLCSHEGGIQWISEIHYAYASLHYILMFSKGENGWHPNIPI